MNNIQIFKHEMFGEIRTMTNEKGETFFVGKDVATALGYSNNRDALNKHVDQEDKTTVAIRDTGSNYKTQVIVINESGLYALVLSSKLPQAKVFKHWVTSEVLPAIRMHVTADSQLPDPDLTPYQWSVLVAGMAQMENGKALNSYSSYDEILIGWHFSQLARR